MAEYFATTADVYGRVADCAPAVAVAWLLLRSNVVSSRGNDG